MSLLTISNCRFSIFIIGDIEMVFFVLRHNRMFDKTKQTNKTEDEKSILNKKKQVKPSCLHV